MPKQYLSYNMKLLNIFKQTLNISTCPNDTFMFDALLNGRIDTEGYRFEPFLADIAELNALAAQGAADITKISCAAYPAIEDKYQLLSSGSALGRGNAPLLVSKRAISPDELEGLTIAIPGATTTAAMLLRIAFGEELRLREYLFSDVSRALLDGEADAGVLIHEERFLYEKKGLKLVADLGTIWEKRTATPVPLGAIAVRRSLDDKTKTDIEKLISASVRYAIEHPDDSRDFVRRYARELEEEVIRRHIEMFVNGFSVDLGDEGRRAVETFFKEAGVELKNDIWLNRQK